MKATYGFKADHLVEVATEEAAIVHYTEPTDAEKADLLSETKLEQADLDAIFDPDEVPRVESVEDGLLIIWKRPDNVTCTETVQFEVSSLGILVNTKRAVLVIPRGGLPLGGREFKQVKSVQDYILRVLLSTVHHYQGHLKAIKMMSQELQAKIVTSMENRYLLQMFALGESLVYYHNALEANLTVLARLRTAADKLKFTADDLCLLDDVVVENQQASKQASIYSTVLSGLMDARGNIINNNVNVLLRNLTTINVVFLPLNLIAGIFGMSEYSQFTSGVDWRIAYSAFAAMLVLLGWATWWWLVRVITRKQTRTRLKPR